MKTPITFEQFSKDPVKGLLFIVIVATVIEDIYIPNNIFFKYYYLFQIHTNQLYLFVAKIYI